MTTKRNLHKAAKTLGKFSLKIPFGQFRIFKTSGRTMITGTSAESDHQFLT